MRLCILAAIFHITLMSCNSDTAAELPTYPVELRLGGTFTPDGVVTSIESASLVLGDLTIYGMDREAAGFLVYAPDGLKHAGHSHGEAEMETGSSSTWLIDLAAAPQTVATNDVTEGHYFDGKVRIRPLLEMYNPVYADGTPVEAENPLWEESVAITGSVTLDGTTCTFSVAGSVEALVSGIVYGGTVMEGGAQTITTLLDLNGLFVAVDWTLLTPVDGIITIDAGTNVEAWLAIKSALQDPLNYVHLEAEEVPTE